MPGDNRRSIGVVSAHDRQGTGGFAEKGGDRLSDLERLVEVEQRCKSNQHRIDALERNQRAIQDMALSVRELATQMKNMKEDQAQISDRLEAIEQKPSKRLDGIITAIISAIAGACITALAGAVMLLR